MILMIDNYDSFTYNLVQYLGQLGQDVQVYRNDEISIDKIRKLAPDAIFLSPGPCSPKEAGITVDVIREFHKFIPITVVCLGHQAIGYAFGGNVVRAGRLMHGKPHRSSMMERPYSRVFPTLLQRDVTIPYSWKEAPYPPVLKSARKRKKGKSWVSGIRNTLWKEYSSIRNRS